MNKKIEHMAMKSHLWTKNPQGTARFQFNQSLILAWDLWMVMKTVVQNG